MTATVQREPQREPQLASPADQAGSGWPVAGLAFRQLRRGVLLVVAVAAVLPALVAVQYRQTFSGALDAASLRALAENPAIRTLFGVPVALDDPGGFTVWRTGTFTAVLVGVWALLAATRITRGEEEARRWDLLLSGRVPLADVVRRHLAVLIACQLLVGATLALALILAQTQPAGALLHGAGLALTGAFFAALGTLAAQLVTGRSVASGLAVAVLGAALLLRMIADGAPGAPWLRWVTPFGLFAQTQPYAADRVAPLVVLAAMATALAVAAVLAARHRDLGGGGITVAAHRPPRLALLSSPTRFAFRRTRPAALAWAVGLGGYFLLIGYLATSLTEFLTGNPRFAELASGAGFGGLASVRGYLAALFGLAAIPVGLFAAARTAATARDEVARHWTLLFALPVSRVRWARAQVVVDALACGLLLVIIGLSAWAGATLGGAPLGLAAALAGALNLLPVALLGLGAAVFAFGFAPQWVLAIGALPGVGGFLLLVLAPLLGLPGWVGSLSPFAHVARVPTTPANWPATLTMTALAVALIAAGNYGFARRDVHS